MLEEFGHAERKNGYRANPSILRLEEGILGACGRILYCIGGCADTGERGGSGPSYRIHE